MKKQSRAAAPLSRPASCSRTGANILGCAVFFYFAFTRQEGGRVTPPQELLAVLLLTMLPMIAVDVRRQWQEGEYTIRQAFNLRRLPYP